MNNRDKSILDDLRRFRMLDRDQIIAIHFSNTKQPITNCNRVLQRLTLKGLIRADRTSRPFKYYLADYNVKVDSQKSNHYKSIADTYIEMLQTFKLSYFEVEPKYGEKGNVEPDVFAIWQGTPFFIEVQRSVYTKKVMDAKIRRYEAFYDSKEWEEFTDKFPILMIISEFKYSINSKLRVVQNKSFRDFANKYRPLPK